MPELAPAAAPEQQQQAPFGVSPATGPTPNKGFEAAGVQRLGLVIKQMTEMFSLFGPGSDIGKDVLKALNILSKHVPPGATTPAGEKNAIEQMALKNAQNGQQLQGLKPQMPGQNAPPSMPRAA